MALVNLRTLSNDSNSVTYDFSSSPTDIVFSEDYNRIRAAIMTGETGLKTYTLQVGDDTTPTSKGEARVNKKLILGGGNSASDAALELTGTSALTGDLAVTGDIAVSGTVDTVNVLLHNHGGGANGAALPLNSITGASGIWSDHDHDGDGSKQVVSAGIEDTAITFAKMNSSAFGLTSSHVARGDKVSEVRTALSDLMLPPTVANDFPTQGQFISIGQMYVVSGDTEAPIESHSGSPGGNIIARNFEVDGATIRMTAIIPSRVDAVKLHACYVIDGVAEDPEPSPGNIDITLHQFTLNQDTYGGSISSAVWSPTATQVDRLTNDPLIGWIPLNSPNQGVGELVHLQIKMTEFDATSVYLVGCFLTYDVNYGA